MKTITGHLTPTNKKHIKHLIDNGFSEGKIGNISYKIEKGNGGQYNVTIKKVDRGLGLIGSEKRISTYKSVIEL